ncbi:MAG: hypothetical protein ACI4NA_06080 [Succinivibrio sp.]
MTLERVLELNEECNALERKVAQLEAQIRELGEIDESVPDGDVDYDAEFSDVRKRIDLSEQCLAATRAMLGKNYEVLEALEEFNKSAGMA